MFAIASSCLKQKQFAVGNLDLQILGFHATHVLANHQAGSSKAEMTEVHQHGTSAYLHVISFVTPAYVQAQLPEVPYTTKLAGAISGYAYAQAHACSRLSALATQRSRSRQHHDCYHSPEA